MDLFEAGDQEVDANGNPYLGFDGIFTRPEEGLNPQVLFNPLEEQFDVPTAFVERGNSLSG